MKNKLFLLLICCLGLASTSLAQTTITTKIGLGTAHPTYVYDGVAYHDNNGSSMAMALAFSRAVGRRFALGTEFGLHAYVNSLDLRTPAKRINGNHERQQVYLAFGPQYSLTKTPGLLSVNAGLALFAETKSELNVYSSVVPMSEATSLPTGAIFGGLSTNPQFGKLGMHFEVRYTVQDVKRSSLGSATIPAKLSLHYLTVFLGLSYHFD